MTGIEFSIEQAVATAFKNSLMLIKLDNEFKIPNYSFYPHLHVLSLIPVPYSGYVSHSAFRFRIPVPYAGSAFRFRIPVPRSGSVFRSRIPVPHSGSVSRIPVLRFILTAPRSAITNFYLNYRTAYTFFIVYTEFIVSQSLFCI